MHALSSYNKDLEKSDSSSSSSMTSSTLIPDHKDWEKEDEDDKIAITLFKQRLFCIKEYFESVTYTECDGRGEESNCLSWEDGQSYHCIICFGRIYDTICPEKAKILVKYLAKEDAEYIMRGMDIIECGGSKCSLSGGGNLLRIML